MAFKNKRQKSAVRSSASVECYTPDRIRSLLARIESQGFPLVLDPCAAKLSEVDAPIRFIYPRDNGLLESWSNRLRSHPSGWVFCNPPYGRELRAWCRKAVTENVLGARVVMLIPGRMDHAAFQDVLAPSASTVIAIKGRLKFERWEKKRSWKKLPAQSALFPSMLVVLDGHRNGPSFTNAVKNASAGEGVCLDVTEC